eukprot:GHUV01004527.1.p1 GENE.GHUV01004527.1~~GHUV01004527.1.p1  ORF type:complete len:223 (+),score=83.57 GHUV01004527.1:1-669(+)
MYGSSMYGGGMYGNSNSMYGSGSMHGSGAMFGGGSMYGSGLGGMYGGGLGGFGMRPPGMPMDPNMPPPAGPPTAWQALLAGVNGVMQFFGRLSFLVDENAHAVHFFISALLQLLDRAGFLYGEIARFVLRVIFRKRRSLKGLPPGVAAAVAAGGKMGLPAPQQQQPGGMLALPPPPRGAVRGSGGFPGAWAPPALPAATASAGVTAADLPTGGHWDNLWADS